MVWLLLFADCFGLCIFVESNNCARRRLFSCVESNFLCSFVGYIDEEGGNFLLCSKPGAKACYCQCGQHAKTIHALTGLCGSSANLTAISNSLNAHSDKGNATRINHDSKIKPPSDVPQGNASLSSDPRQNTRLTTHILKWTSGGGHHLHMRHRGSRRSSLVTSDDFPVPGSALAALAFIVLIGLIGLLLWFYKKPQRPTWCLPQETQ